MYHLPEIFIAWGIATSTVFSKTYWRVYFALTNISCYAKICYACLCVKPLIARISLSSNKFWKKLLLSQHITISKINRQMFSLILICTVYLFHLVHQSKKMYKINGTVGLICFCCCYCCFFQRCDIVIPAITCLCFWTCYIFMLSLLVFTFL